VTHTPPPALSTVGRDARGDVTGDEASDDVRRGEETIGETTVLERGYVGDENGGEDGDTGVTNGIQDLTWEESAIEPMHLESKL
jgi:hypothetical protein